MMPKTHKDNLGLMMILCIPVIIQSGFFSILLIQYSESTLFRLFIGFVGIGLSIVPILLSRVLPEINKGKSSFLFFSLSEQQNFVLDIFSLIAITIIPWIPVFQSNAFAINKLSEAIIPGSAVMLASSIMGFCLAAVYVFIRDFKTDGITMGVFRFVVIAMCLAAAVNIIIPTLYLLMFKISILLGNPKLHFFELATSTNFRIAIIRNISDIFSWYLYFIVGMILQFRFFKRWLIKTKAN